MNGADGPPGLAIDTAQRIILTHAADPPARCAQCRERRCWLLETAVKVVVFDGSPIDPRLHAAITAAARRIADVHAPGDDRLCSPCLLEECEPLEIATAWLHVTGERTAVRRTAVDVLTPDLDEARRVVRQHQGYGCPRCTPAGCPAEDAAVPVVFSDVASRWPEGPKTLAEVERIAREMRGDG
ncbi:hypothetical protein ACN28C_13490 [Plantactinospora sp. WMMC1484]|uniref:hypothetical protein n=1 Tax=Plantactinospora sp. WMMC1484 TaxID=3404122 RepID=UPI003BF486A6